MRCMAFRRVFRFIGSGSSSRRRQGLPAALVQGLRRVIAGVQIHRVPGWSMKSDGLEIMQESAQLRVTARRLITESHQITRELHEVYDHLVYDLEAAREGQLLTPLREHLRW